MEYVLTQLLNGLVYGVLLFLLAAGLSLIFGLMNVVNLAHGSFFMIGAFIGLSIVKLTGSFWIALLIAPVAVGALSVALELLFMRRVYRRGHLDQILLTFSFTFIFYDLSKWIWGPEIMTLPTPLALEGSFPFIGIVFPSYRIFLIVFGFVLAALLWLLIERSRLGAMIRAGVDNAKMANGLGINIELLFTAVFALGGAIAALAGVVAGPVLGVYAGMDVEILIPAFIVIVIGGMGSLRGAFVGSLLIGEIDTFGKGYLPSMALFLIYLTMIVVLLTKPTGLFGVGQEAHQP